MGQPAIAKEESKQGIKNTQPVSCDESVEALPAIIVEDVDLTQATELFVTAKEETKPEIRCERFVMI